MNQKKEKNSSEKTFLGMLQEVFSGSSVPVLTKPYLWNDFMEYMSNEIDRKIISYSREKRYIYIGGKCHFTPTIEETEFDRTTILNVDAELYFKMSDGEKIERLPLHTERNYHDFNLEDEHTLKTLRGLLKEQLEVSVAKPE